VAISFASLRSRLSGILNLLTAYVSGVLLPRALACSLLATAQDSDRRRKARAEQGSFEIPNAPSLQYSIAPRFL
jgi:hypothetical protein